MRNWKASDSTEVEEVSQEELWERVQDESQEFVDRRELRDES